MSTVHSIRRWKEFSWITENV